MVLHTHTHTHENSPFFSAGIMYVFAQYFFLSSIDHRPGNMQRRNNNINFDLPSTSRAHNATPIGVAGYDSRGVWHGACFADSEDEGPLSASLSATPAPVPQIVLKPRHSYGLRSTQNTIEPASTYVSSLIDWTSDDEDVDDGDLGSIYTPWQPESLSPTSPIAPPSLDNDMDTIDEPTFSPNDSNSQRSICDGEDGTDMDTNSSDSDDDEDPEVEAILDLQRTLIGILTKNVTDRPQEIADAWDDQDAIFWMELLQSYQNLASQRRITHINHRTEALYDLTFSDIFEFSHAIIHIQDLINDTEDGYYTGIDAEECRQDWPALYQSWWNFHVELRKIVHR